MINANSVSGVTKESFRVPYWKQNIPEHGEYLMNKEHFLSQKTIFPENREFFVDVPNNHPLWTYIEELYTKGLVQGYAEIISAPIKK